MDHTDIEGLLTGAPHLGLRLLAGPAQGPAIQRVVIAPIDELRASAGSLVIVTTRDGQVPSPYQVDVAVRRAIAHELGGLLFIGDLTLARTARSLAEHGKMRVLTCAPGPATEIAMDIDRVVRGDAVSALARAEFAIDRATELARAAPVHASEAILAAAGEVLGVELTLTADTTASWSEKDAVCVGETPVGRLTATSSDPAVTLALPVIASILSRAVQRELGDRFARTQSRSELVVELILADATRAEALAADAARLGMPLHLSHAAGWLRLAHATDPARRPSRAAQSAIELFALQLAEPRKELWHVATLHDDVILVATEEPGEGDHQRRLREVSEQVKRHATSVAGDEWIVTLGLGTPQLAASGLRQSAAEARIAVESAIAAGGAGTIEATDVTGLRRVLLDFYASPLSRRLLDDLLTPLDAWGPERAWIAVETLQAYLANRNSLARAAAQLNLHPNAVNYRVRRAEAALELDLSDPDHRFAVELACRVRLLAIRPR